MEFRKRRELKWLEAQLGIRGMNSLRTFGFSETPDKAGDRWAIICLLSDQSPDRHENISMIVFGEDIFHRLLKNPRNTKAFHGLPIPSQKRHGFCFTPSAVALAVGVGPH